MCTLAETQVVQIMWALHQLISTESDVGRLMRHMLWQTDVSPISWHILICKYALLKDMQVFTASKHSLQQTAQMKWLKYSYWCKISRLNIATFIWNHTCNPNKMGLFINFSLINWRNDSQMNPYNKSWMNEILLVL